MHTLHVRTAAMAFAAGTIALSGCSSPDRGPVARSSQDMSSGASIVPTDTVVDTTATPASEVDARTLRDDLLRLAASAPFGRSGWAADTTIVETWLETYPTLQRTLLDDQLVDPATVSSSSAFLIDDTTGAGDQSFAWAVVDAGGTCAGAVVIIPGEPDGSVSDADVPTRFVPVDELRTCSARGAIDALTEA